MPRSTAPMRYQILTVVGYVASMGWITAYAPVEAKWPALIILHVSFVLGYLIGKPEHD
jgi:hypothetical protein